jgi:hypothetical protein
MSPFILPIVLVFVSVASATAGWVFRDARARGLPMRKALTWAVISTQEFPLIFLLYRRVRPRRIRGDEPTLRVRDDRSQGA